jgi:starch phosphorylase
MEFLIGRLLDDGLINLRLHDAAREALLSFGCDPDKVIADEPDAALGNGGLGRLAACFLESLSTLGVPAHGYGIRYEHGLFRQRIVDGRQVELPETWLAGTPCLGVRASRDTLSHRLRRDDQRQSLGTGGGRDGRRL